MTIPKTPVSYVKVSKQFFYYIISLSTVVPLLYTSLLCLSINLIVIIGGLST